MSAREDLLCAPAHRELARALYAEVRELPLVCPHGHVDPWLLADPQATLGTPAELFLDATVPICGPASP